MALVTQTYNWYPQFGSSQDDDDSQTIYPKKFCDGAGTLDKVTIEINGTAYHEFDETNNASYAQGVAYNHDKTEPYLTNAPITVGQWAVYSVDGEGANDTLLGNLAVDGGTDYKSISRNGGNVDFDKQWNDSSSQDNTGSILDYFTNSCTPQSGQSGVLSVNSAIVKIDAAHYNNQDYSPGSPDTTTDHNFYHGVQVNIKYYYT
jgi:hypothetical protein